MYTNPFNRKHSTIRQVLDRLLDPTRKPIRRSESVSSSGSNSSKSSNGSFGSSSTSSHGHRGILQWVRVVQMRENKSYRTDANHRRSAGVRVDDNDNDGLGKRFSCSGGPPNSLEEKIVYNHCHELANPSEDPPENEDERQIVFNSPEGFNQQDDEKLAQLQC